LADPSEQDAPERAPADPDPALLPLLAELAATGESRLLVTSRQAPAGLDAEPLRLGRLTAPEGRALVKGVLEARGLEPAAAAAPNDTRDTAENDAPEGETPWIDRLVRVVRGHPRALVLLAPEVARRGLEATHQELVPLMDELDRRAGSDEEKRESSLLASVRLSLRRLTPEERHRARALTVFRQAAEVQMLAHVLQESPEESARLCVRLVELGLGELHLVQQDQAVLLAFFLPDPGLGPALGVDLGRGLERGLGRGLGEGLGDEESPGNDERVALEERWFEAVPQLVGFLVQQRQHADARVAADGSRLALGELLAWIEGAEERVEAGGLSAAEAVRVVGAIESLLENLGRRRALERIVAARRRLAGMVEAGTHAGLESRRRDVERALQAGDLPRALELAEALHRDTEALGDDAYPEAAYDRAVAPYLVGHVLHAAGAADRALPLFKTARKRFLALAEGNNAAVGMAAACLTRQGDCHLSLGRLDKAAEAYKAALADDEAAGRTRDVAVGKTQLGTVRMHQGDIETAVKLHREARAAFEALGDPAAIASTWHQEAMAWRRAGQHEQAEHCYLASLEIESRIGNRVGEAQTLNELGNLYAGQGRLEEAVAQYSRAAEIYADAGQNLREARALGNRADQLRKLGRLQEARADLSRVLELKRPFGLAAEPWKTHSIRSEIEAATGDASAAAEARAEAIRLYAAYRDGGGAPQQVTGRLVEALRTQIADGAEPAALARQLPPADRFPEDLQPFRAALEALLRGHPADPDDPRHDYDDVVELRRLQAALRERRGG
jgi:tetratricopeptide (TPR) repeat protein